MAKDISDQEAFRVLGLPLGVDRDAIRERYKQLSNKLSVSKLPEDIKKLEHITSAFNQLIPLNQRQVQPNNTSNKQKNSKARNQVNHDVYDSSDDDAQKGRKGNIRNGHLSGNGNDLDRDKKKAEKKKAKKKKQKEKKKQGKGESTQNDDRVAESDTESEEETVEDVQDDHNSAFVAMMGKKFNSNGVYSNPNSSNNVKAEDNNKKSKNNDKPNVVMLEARQIQSRQLAMRGNEEANTGEYKRAIHLFSEAIRLDPNDHRFFGNRSYCYGQLHQYVEALKDADKAIKLAPEWPKGHFRRGRALKGLGKLLESEEAFKEVLRFDPSCEDAIVEITKVRKKRLVDMGFTELQAKAAIKKYAQVQPALDALLSGEFQSNLENLFFSEEDDEDEQTNEAPVSWQPQPTKPKDEKMNPKNLHGLTSLWVGNVVPEVTEKILTKLFSKHGHVTSVRQLKEKYCAFVNYSDKKAAGIAMDQLQGYDLLGSKLLIKFPDNPIVNGSQNIIIRKNKHTNTRLT